MSSQDPRLERLRTLAEKTPTKIVLLVVDGVGDIRTADQPKTALEAANTPALDALAARSALGRLVPASTGITPGSGPGHLGLFGYDPLVPSNDIGRGALEALGLGLEMDSRTIAARGNFATVDQAGDLIDRRAGRIATEECARLVALLNEALRDLETGDLSLSFHAGEGYRFVLLVCGEGLAPEIRDTDPQKLGVPPLPLAGETAAGSATATRLTPLLDQLRGALTSEDRANSFLLRGFARLPQLESFEALYRLDAGAFAGYPLYRGVASACGMEVVECGLGIGDIIAVTRSHWDRFDFFFLHVKQTDQAGEDGDLQRKIDVLEEVDAALPELLALEPDVLAITGDHSTPAPMKAHSWHPVPLLVSSPVVGLDDTDRFDELAAVRGSIGTLPSRDLLGLLLANAGKLAKFGA